MTTKIKNARILDLISKENQLKSQIALYETINKEYSSVGNIDTLEKKNKVYSLINDMTNINNTISSLAIDIKKLRNSLTDYNIRLDNLKLINNSKLNNLIESIGQETIHLNDIREKVNSADGSNKEFSKVYKSNNIKYIFWLFATIILFIAIFRSITSSEETTLEKFIFILLIIVGIYYIFVYVSDKLRSIDFNKKTKSIFNNFKPSVYT